MEQQIDILINESNRENCRASDIIKYAIKRNKINLVSEKLGYREKRDGRTKGKLVYSNVHDKARYCMMHGREKDKNAVKNAYRNFKRLENRILLGNLRLVLHEAQKYCAKGSPGKNDILDLIQEGWKGVLHAAGKYETSMKYRFSTYAVPWIKQYIIGYIKDNSHEKVARIPRHIWEMISKIRNGMKKKKVEKNLNELTKKEVMKLGGLNKTEAENVIIAIGMGNTLSLDNSLNDDSEDFTIKDTIGEEDYFPDYALMETVSRCMSNLKKREQNVIKYIFGKKYTLDKVGRIFHISRERIRQIKYVALKKMRAFLEQQKFVRQLKFHNYSS